MGLFDLRKKKEDSPLSKISEQSTTPPTGGVVDFDKLALEVPPPPAELKKPESQPPIPTQELKEEPPKHPEEELPAQDAPTAPEQPQGLRTQTPLPTPKPVFELPDFNEQELRELEELRHIQQQEKTEKKPEAKPTPKPALRPISKPKPIKPTPIVKPIEIPKPVTPEIKEKFISIGTYFSIKENLDNIRTLTNKIGRIIDRHEATSKEGEAKYRALIKDLDCIQEQLMLIDNKLFEKTEPYNSKSKR